jgi:hypothetical protein
MAEPPIHDTHAAAARIGRETGEAPATVRAVLDGHVRFLELAGPALAGDPEALALERQLHAELLPGPGGGAVNRDALLLYLYRTSGLTLPRLARILAAEGLHLEEAGLREPGTHRDHLAWVREVDELAAEDLGERA